MGAMLALSAPLVVMTKDVPAGPRATVAPRDPGAERTGVPEKWTVDTFALSVIVTTRVPPAFANPLTLLSVNVNEAVPADEPPIRMLPAEITEVDASAGMAPITVTSPASSVAARPKLTARLVWSPTSGGLQLTDLTVTDAAFGVVTAVRSRPSVNRLAAQSRVRSSSQASHPSQTSPEETAAEAYQLAVGARKLRGGVADLSRPSPQAAV